MELLFFRSLPAAGLSFAAVMAFLLVGRLALSPLRFTGRPALSLSLLAGLLVFVAASWFCVLFDAARYIAQVFAALTLLLGAQALYAAKRRGAIRAAFSLGAMPLQAVVFLFCANVVVVLLYLHNIPAGRLPFYTLGNNDIFYFFNVSNFLSKPLSVASGFPIEYVYELKNDVFGVFSLVALMSGAYAHNMLAAPSLLAFVFSLLFLALYDLLSSTLSGLNVLLLFVAFFSSPLVSFIVGHFFLGQMLSWGVLVCLVGFSCSGDADAFGLCVAASFVLYGFLLFFYPSYCLPMLALHGLFLVGQSLREIPRSRASLAWAARRLAVRLCCGLLVPFALLYGVFFSRMPYAVNMMFAQAGGSQGWSLPMLSLVSLSAFPVDIAAGSGAVGLVQLAAACGAVFALLLAAPGRGTPAIRDQRLVVLAGVYVFSLVLYGCYFLYVGESYKQWKLATFLVLPLFFVPLLLGHARLAGWIGRRASQAVVGVCLLALCVASIRAHNAGPGAARHYPGEAGYFSEAFLSLDAVNTDEAVSTVCLKLKPYAETMLAMNFLWAKKVFSVSESYFPAVRAERLAPGPGTVFVSTLACSVEDTGVAVLDDFFYVAARGFSSPSPAIMPGRVYAFDSNPSAASCFTLSGMKVGKDGAVAYAADAALDFQIPHAPQGYTAEVSLSGFTHPPNAPVTVEIYCNGTLLRTVALRDLARTDVVELTIPAGLLADGGNTLRFVSGELNSPKLFDAESSDTARYGFLLRRIRFAQRG